MVTLQTYYDKRKKRRDREGDGSIKAKAPTKEEKEIPHNFIRICSQ